ncbi:MAG: antibiotic biosynthesis monooxygenase [Thiohalomonadales bacterium]
MEVTIIHVSVKEEFIEEFKNASHLSQLAAVQESGNMRFDILQSNLDPTQFALYKSFDTKFAAAAHKDTKHYRDWRKAVEPWMADSRVGVGYTGLFTEKIEQ